MRHWYFYYLMKGGIGLHSFCDDSIRFITPRLSSLYLFFYEETAFTCFYVYFLVKPKIRTGKLWSYTKDFPARFNAWNFLTESRDSIIFFLQSFIWFTFVLSELRVNKPSFWAKNSCFLGIAIVFLFVVWERRRRISISKDVKHNARLLRSG